MDQRVAQPGAFTMRRGDSPSDAIRHLPNMWLASGKQVGSTGRLLSGLESLAMYAVEVLALIGLWCGRRRLSAWFLFLVAAAGMIALGLVVVNVGTLYRLRYVFLMLLIILAAERAARVLDRLSKKPRENEGHADDQRN